MTTYRHFIHLFLLLLALIISNICSAQSINFFNLPAKNSILTKANDEADAASPANESYDSFYSPPQSTKPVFTAKNKANEMIALALGHIGVKYRYGGNTPESGFDCSGLVRWVFDRSFGLSLPRRAEQIAKVGNQINKDELKPGDLVFFNTLKKAFSHVGIYLGDNKFLHAPSAGGKVRVENLNEKYWAKRWNGGRRIEAGEEYRTTQTTFTLPQPIEIF